jgi:hypothetical protein
VRFVKVFPVPKSCDAGAIRARMNINSARLYALLPKRSPSPSPSKDKESEQQSIGENKGQGSAGSSSRSSSSGSLNSAREDAEKDRVEEKEQRGDQGVEEQKPAAVAPQDSPKRSDGDANDAERNDGDDKGDSEKWWRKITAVHVLGFVLILALVGVGATLLYVMLL